MEILDYGVCRLSVVPVRKTGTDQAELVTQLLFGDDYEVIEMSQDRKWIRIRIHFDRYEGWIDARQHHSVTKEYFDYAGSAEFKITTDITSSLLYNKAPVPILLGKHHPDLRLGTFQDGGAIRFQRGFQKSRAKKGI